MQWQDLFITATQLNQLINDSTDSTNTSESTRITKSAKPLEIFDCRFSLAVGDKPAKGKAFYDESHIPGSEYLDLEQDLSGQITNISGRHPLPNKAQQNQLIDRYQLDSDTTIICYDDGKLAFAARAWFTFHLMGFHRVRLLSGGLPAWQSINNQISNANQPSIDPEYTLEKSLTLPLSAVTPPIQLNTLTQVLSEPTVLIDAREAVRFQGKQEPIDPVAGAIPNAINMPWLDCFNEDGQFKPVNWHRSRWQNTNTPCHYCGSGVTALVNLLSALLANNNQQHFYAGGWSEYIHSKHFSKGSNKAD